MRITLAILLATFTASAHPVVTETFLDSVAMIESSGRAGAIGDGGKARGMFQFWPGSWEDARIVNPLIGDYQTGSVDPVRARLAARTYLTILAVRYQKRASRSPSPQELYAMYNIGFGGFFSKYGGDISKCPAITQRAIKRIKP